MEARIWTHDHDPVELVYEPDSGRATLVWTEGPDGGYATEPLESVEVRSLSDIYGLMDRYNTGVVAPPWYHDASGRDPPDFSLGDMGL
jgi:hypothetical protein